MDHWTEILRRCWGITANVTKLDGEFDQNFLVETSEEAGFVLKVMRPDCPFWLVEMQIAAMRYIAARDPQVPIPRVIASLAGEDVTTLTDEKGAARLVWLITRLPGRVYAQVTPKTGSLIGQVGVALGRTARALSDFSHPRLERDFKWDLMRADWITGHFETSPDLPRKALLASDLAAFEAIRPALKDLPRQAIHNDANDYNILAAGGPGDIRVSGLIDFGDMCAGPRICDLAIAAAYIVLDHPQPDRALEALVVGYHTVFPLTGGVALLRYLALTSARLPCGHCRLRQVPARGILST